MQKYIVVQAWTQVIVADKPTADLSIQVSDINKDFYATLEYDHGKGQLVAPELKNATYTFYYNNAVQQVQSSNVLDTTRLQGKSGLFKVMVSAPGIDQVSEP